MENLDGFFKCHRSEEILIRKKFILVHVNIEFPGFQKHIR